MSKNVLVTGASTGIGASCAHYLDARGFRVFAGVRRDEDAERLRASASERLTPVHLDVVDTASIEAVRESIANAVGDAGLFGLVNNAGISVSGPVEFTLLDAFRRQFDVNVFGQIAVTQAFVPLIRSATGRIVNMSSISGRVTAPLLSPYSMSKFALEAFSDALRRELHPWNIHVACVQPGAIDTPIWNKGLDAPENQLENRSEAEIELYGNSVEALRQLAARSRDRAVPAERVAEVVHHALTAKRPKTRYRVGPDALIGGFIVRFLPDRLLDAIMRRMSGL